MDPSVDIRIELTTPDDVPLLFGLIGALAEYERMTDQLVATEADLRESLFGARPAAEAAIARAGDEPVAYALWFYNYSTFQGRQGLYLEDVFVRPEWRSRGVGRALMTYVAGVAVARGCVRMEWVVLDWNESAIRFYQGLGAQPMDEWTVFRLTGNALTTLARRD